MNQTAIDFARLARDSGMARAAEHADKADAGWNEKAYDFLVEFARTHGQFISEDVSDASKAVGFPQPPTDRAWGSAYKKAIKRGVIVRAGIGRSRRRHASICPLWASRIVSAAA